MGKVAGNHRHRPFRRLVFVSALTGSVALLGGACSSGDDSADDTTTTTASAEIDAETMMKWQRELAAVGCYSGPIDGIEGTATFAAIEEFQRAEGIAVDGAIGETTGSALDSAFAQGRIVCASATTTTTAGGDTTTTTAGGGTTTTTAGGGTTTTTAGGTTTTASPTTTSPPTTEGSQAL